MVPRAGDGREPPAKPVLTSDSTMADARLFALPQGVVVATASIASPAAPDATTRKLTLSVKATSTDATSTDLVSGSTDLTPAQASELRLLELARFGETFWAILLLKGQPYAAEILGDAKLNLYEVKDGNESLISAAFDLDPDASGRPVAWAVNKTLSSVRRLEPPVTRRARHAHRRSI